MAFLLRILIPGILLLNLSFAQTTLFPGLTGEELIDSLRANYKPATVLSYNQARDTMYAKIFNVDDSLSGAYSDFTIYLDPMADPTTDAGAKGINTEHTWPQSKGAGSGNPRSDMHHLFPSKATVNSARANYPFAEIDDTDTDFWYRKDISTSTTPTQFIEEYSELDTDVQTFEPREDQKGNSARAIFYFYTIYRDEAVAGDPLFFDLQKDVLFAWHFLDNVDATELTRTNLIANYQDGKPNPFVIDTSLVRRAYFSTGTNSPPTQVIFNNVTTTSFDIQWLLPAGYDGMVNQLLILIKEGAPVDGDPTAMNIANYTANPSFGNGTEVGSGNFTIYNGDGSDGSVSGLIQNTTYHIEIWNTQNGTSWSSTTAVTSQTTESATPPQSGDIMITEILKNPSAVFDENGEWFELFNASNMVIDINGWVLKDEDIDSIIIDNGGALLIAPDSFLVLGNNANSAVNGGVAIDYAYNGGEFFLGNNADELILCLSDGITEVDRIVYDNGVLWPDPNGASMVFFGTPADDNGSPAFWSASTMPWPGSFGDLGSPGYNGDDQALPVELLLFRASVEEDGVLLHWATASEIDNLGFEIYRSANSDSNYQKIATFETHESLQGAGNTNIRQDYQFLDASIPAPGEWWYQLADVDFNGQRIFHPAISVDFQEQTTDGTKPVSFVLHQNFPNPFNQSTIIQLDISENTTAQPFGKIIIYDISGKKIKTLFQGTPPPGKSQFRWRGIDHEGYPVASGIFFAVAQFGDSSKHIKMVLAK